MNKALVKAEKDVTKKIIGRDYFKVEKEGKSIDVGIDYTIDASDWGRRWKLLVEFNLSIGHFIDGTDQARFEYGNRVISCTCRLPFKENDWDYLDKLIRPFLSLIGDNPQKYEKVIKY